MATLNNPISPAIKSKRTDAFYTLLEERLDSFDIHKLMLFLIDIIEKRDIQSGEKDGETIQRDLAAKQGAKELLLSLSEQLGIFYGIELALEQGASIEKDLLYMKKTIRKRIKLAKYKGTKYAIEELFRDVPGMEISIDERLDDRPDIKHPYIFGVGIYLKNRGLDARNQTLIFKLIDEYKRATTWYEYDITVRLEDKINYAIIANSSVFVRVLPGGTVWAGLDLRAAAKGTTSISVNAPAYIN